jgi:origin recognition complex subunit 1
VLQESTTSINEPAKMAPPDDGKHSTPKRSRADRARQYLSSGAVAREDSDDELGLVDYEWEWIYDGDDSTNLVNGASQDALEKKEQVETPSRKKKQSKSKRIIKGARMGSFECKIGDTVLLKSPEAGKAWVGVILYFLEDEEIGKAACFMWFSSEAEITKHKRKRTDALPQELYLTPAYDVNCLAAINGKATVCSGEKFFDRFPKGKPPGKNRKQIAEYSKWFVCRRACNTRTVTYTDEFVWEEYFPAKENIAIQDLLDLVDRVTEETKLSRKRKAEKVDTDVSI